MNVLLIYGGASPEHEVSVRSAETIYKGLKEFGHDVYLGYITKEDHWLLVRSVSMTTGEALSFDTKSQKWQAGSQQISIDIVFPIVHGVGGEDGQLQSHLESISVPYVGCDAEVSRRCFDKVATKKVLADAGLRVVPFVVWHSTESAPSFSKLQQKLKPVLFIKPSRSGSSIGVHKVTDENGYARGLQDASKYDKDILIESAVNKPRELEVAVLELEPRHLQASGVGEIIPGEEFYSYDDKYDASSTAQTVVEPDLSEGIMLEARKLATKAAELLGCRGMVRVDFLYDSAEKVLYINELNTLPGFTGISMYPKLWEKAGLPIDQLVDKLVRVASESKK